MKILGDIKLKRMVLLSNDYVLYGHAPTDFSILKHVPASVVKNLSALRLTLLIRAIGEAIKRKP